MDGVIGVIWMFGGNFAPRSWALCQGQILQISNNTALFSILGTTFGGDGRVTFALPDLRGRVPIHAGNGPGLSSRTIGQQGGIESVILNMTQIPSHNHPTSINVSNQAGEEGNASGQFLANHANAFNEDGTSGQFLGGVVNNNTGGSQAHTNIQPFTVVNYVICLVGIYPSRN